MPKYVYESLSATGEVLRTFEVWQGINEPALESDPETGAAVRRIISATAVIGGGTTKPAAATPSAHSCRSGGCGCKH